MTYSAPTRAAARRMRIRGTRAGLVVVATVAAALGYQSLASSPSTIPARSTASPPTRAAPPIIHVPGRRHPGPSGHVDGDVPDGTTVFDDEVAGVARLHPALLAALRRAATDAGGDGVEFFVDSGWRSPAYQERLLQQAILKYGSEQAAARWVATPETSPHVSGDAVDIGRSNATAWLSEHGARYGLCQIYANEPWHYELRPAAVARGCPAMYADPTHDPRMQRSNP